MKQIITLTLVLLLATPALAEESQFYGGVNVGGEIAESGLKDGYGGGLVAGWQINPYVALDAQYNFYLYDDNDSISFLGRRASLTDYEVHTFEAATIITPIQHRLRPFVSIGFMYVKSKFNIRETQSGRNTSYDIGETGFAYGGGFIFDVDDKISIRPAYKRGVSEIDADLWRIGLVYRF